MSSPTNHWKLGLFVVGSVLIGLTALVYVGAQTLHKETVEYKSYFDEAVMGLQLGSPVTFRGVTLGNVSGIDVARDRRHVEITYAVGVKELGRLGLAVSHGQSTKIKVPPDLRVQLASSGITGSKYLTLDFFPIASNPLPVLPFEVGPNYIPATPSTLKSLEAAVVQAADAIPDLAGRVTDILTQVSDFLADARAQRLPEQAGATMASAERTFAMLRVKLERLEVEKLSAEARAALGNINTILTKVDGVLARLQSKRGLIASLERASNGVGDVAQNVRVLGPDLADTLEEVREAAESLRALTSALERDPDMLLKGRSQESE